MFTPRSSVALALTLVFAACGGAERAAETAEAEQPEEQAEPQSVMPETTADAVWAYLTEVDYQNTFALWPDKGEQYTGQEPHGALLTTYVNDVAAGALASNAGELPYGAIIVKENFMPDGTHAASTVMYKAEGFDPDNNDWWWLKRLADGTVEASGQATGCINCHGGQRPNDFVWTSSLSGM